MAFKQGGPDFGWWSIEPGLLGPRRTEEVSERKVDELGPHWEQGEPLLTQVLWSK